MNKNLAVGTRVVYAATRGATRGGRVWRRYGNVIENPGEGRVRVKWDYIENPDGTTKPYTLRTWFATNRLSVVPSEVL